MQHDDLSNNNLEHIQDTNNNNHHHSLHKETITYNKQQQQQSVHVDVEFHFIHVLLYPVHVLKNERNQFIIQIIVITTITTV